ncbi:MAG: serine/threonine-protein kinase [Gemmataceae bacterium]
MSSSNSERDPVERLAEEFAERLRRGERPSLTEYTRQHPDRAEEIRELFPALAAMEQLKPRPGDLTGDFAGAPADDAQPRQLGEYRLLREVGRGGMGVVYEAEQVSLGRHVALKLLPPQARLNPTFLERFRREAKAAAQLHHTNIVPVFGVGEHNGTPFYAMQFIAGEGLDRVLADLRRLRGAGGEPPGEAASVLLSGLSSPTAAGDTATHPLGRVTPPSGSGLSASGPEGEFFRGVARLGLQVAEALAHAHKQGVLHRDIKPSNLLLDAHGTVWVTDFGLAKAEGADELTHTGDIVGTVRFMAPERFDGRSLPQSDVYALGLTLYELLTLRPAFDDTNKARLIDKVMHAAPTPPRRIDPRVPRDLETVVLKCLAKEPAERYPTAAALAEDLRRFLSDRPIKARRSTLAEQTWRWCRRNPVVASLSAAVFTLIALTAVGGVALSISLGRALSRATAAEREGRRKLFESHLSEARAQRFSGRAGQRFGTLEAVRQAAELARELGLPDTHLDELRELAIAALALPDYRREPGEAGGWFDGYAVDWAVRVDDSRWFTLSGGDLSYFGPPSGRLVRRLALFEWAGPEVPASRWRDHFHTLVVHPFRPVVAFALISIKGPVTRVIDLESGEVTALPETSPDWTGYLGWLPDGNSLAAGYSDKVVVWDVAARKPLRVIREPPGGGMSAVVNQAGEILTWSNWAGGFKLWHGRTGQLLLTVPDSKQEFGRDSNSGRLVGKFEGRGMKTTGWAVHSAPECRTLARDPTRPDVGAYWRNAVHPGGRLAAVGTSGGVTLFDLDTCLDVAHLDLGHAWNVAFDPANGDLVTYGERGLFRWPVRGKAGSLQVGPPQQLPLPGKAGSAMIQLSRDGRTVAVAQGTSAVVLRGERRVELGPLEDVRSHLALSPDGRWAATGRNDGHGGDVRVWDAETGELVKAFGMPDGMNVAFSPDGRWLAGSDKAGYRFWHVGTWEEGPQTRVATPRFVDWPAVFSPDGRLLALERGDGAVRLIDAATGRELAALGDPHQGRAGAMSFSPDGRRLLLTIKDHGVLRLWDLARLREGLTPLGVNWAAPPYPPGPSAVRPPAPLRVQVDRGPLPINPAP